MPRSSCSMPAAVEGAQVHLDDAVSLALELGAEGGANGVGGQVEHLRERSQHDHVLPRASSRLRRRYLLEGDLVDDGLSRAGERDVVGRRRVGGIAEHHGASFNYKLRLEFAVIGPVEGDQHVQLVSLREHGILADAHLARAFAAPNLRAETFQHEGVQPLARRGPDEEIARHDHAVTAASGDADCQISVPHTSS